MSDFLFVPWAQTLSQQHGLKWMTWVLSTELWELVSPFNCLAPWLTGNWIIVHNVWALRSQDTLIIESFLLNQSFKYGILCLFLHCEKSQKQSQWWWTQFEADKWDTHEIQFGTFEVVMNRIWRFTEELRLETSLSVFKSFLKTDFYQMAFYLTLLILSLSFTIAFKWCCIILSAVLEFRCCLTSFYDIITVIHLQTFHKIWPNNRINVMRSPWEVDWWMKILDGTIKSKYFNLCVEKWHFLST